MALLAVIRKGHVGTFHITPSDRLEVRPSPRWPWVHFLVSPALNLSSGPVPHASLPHHLALGCNKYVEQMNETNDDHEDKGHLLCPELCSKSPLLAPLILTPALEAGTSPVPFYRRGNENHETHVHMLRSSGAAI